MVSLWWFFNWTSFRGYPEALDLKTPLEISSSHWKTVKERPSRPSLPKNGLTFADGVGKFHSKYRLHIERLLKKDSVDQVYQKNGLHHFRFPKKKEKKEEKEEDQDVTFRKQQHGIQTRETFHFFFFGLFFFWGLLMENNNAHRLPSRTALEHRKTDAEGKRTSNR